MTNSTQSFQTARNHLNAWLVKYPTYPFIAVMAFLNHQPAHEQVLWLADRAIEDMLEFSERNQALLGTAYPVEVVIRLIETHDTLHAPWSLLDGEWTANLTIEMYGRRSKMLLQERVISLYFNAACEIIAGH